MSPLPPPAPPIDIPTVLTTVDEIRSAFNIGTAFDDGPIEEAIALAGAVVSKYVGSTVYSDALLGSSAEDAPRAAMLKAAEGRVAVYYLILNAGTGIRRGGLIKQEQDAAGPLNGTVINQYLTPKEIRELRDQYLEEALGLLADYWDPEVGVNVLGRGGIEVGQIVSGDVEPDTYLGTIYDGRNYF